MKTTVSAERKYLFMKKTLYSLLALTLCSILVVAVIVLSHPAIHLLADDVTPVR